MPNLFGLISILSAQVITATAQPTPRQNELGFALGTSSPSGVYGLVYGWLPTPSFKLQTGIGLGIGGLHLSATPTFIYGKRHAVFAGVGPSVSLQPRPDPLNQNHLWANGEFGYRFQARRLFVEVGGGYSMILNGRMKRPCICDDGKILRPGDGLVSFRISSGVRF